MIGQERSLLGSLKQEWGDEGTKGPGNIKSPGTKKLGVRRTEINRVASAERARDRL